MLRRIARLCALVPLAAVLLIPETASAGPAKPTTTVAISKGTVVTGGVEITLKYTCFPTGYGPYGTFGDVRVAQANGVTGDTFFRPTCNDQAQTQDIFVPGNFTPADAAVSAFICGFDCNSASREIRLH
jgi:hypothetical protein